MAVVLYLLIRKIGIDGDRRVRREIKRQEAKLKQFYIPKNKKTINRNRSKQSDCFFAHDPSKIAHEINVALARAKVSQKQRIRIHYPHESPRLEGIYRWPCDREQSSRN